MCDKIDQEFIWSEFHKLHSSDDYCSKWTSYLSTSNDFHVSPLFYQHVTFEIFEALLSNELQGRAQCSETAAINISSDEENAIHYMAGYVIRQLRKKYYSMDFLTV